MGEEYVNNGHKAEEAQHAVLCPICHKGHFVMRSGKRNTVFWGCSNFPACKTTCEDKEGAPDLTTLRHNGEKVPVLPSVQEIDLESVFSDVRKHVRVNPVQYRITADVLNLLYPSEEDLEKGNYKYCIYKVCDHHKRNQFIRIKLDKAYLNGKNPTELKDKRITVEGKLDIYSEHAFDIQIIVSKLLKIEPCSRLTEIQQIKENPDYKKFFSDRYRIPHAVDPENLMIGLISKEASHAHKDFLGKLNESLESKVVRQDVKKLSIEAIIEGIKELEKKFDAKKAQNNDLVGMICIVRGGGDAEDLCQYSSVKFLGAIYDSKYPIIIGIGHTDDELLCKEVADYAAEVPAGAADYINKLVNIYKKKQNEQRKENYHQETQKKMQKNINDKEKEIQHWQSKYNNVLKEYNRLQEQYNTAKTEMDALKAKVSALENQLNKKGFFSRIFG